MHLISPADERLDAFHAALDAARALKPDNIGMVGYGVAELFDGDGRTKQLVPFHNLITDAGDLYIANRIVFGINSNGISAPTAAGGMKLGTGSTAATKTDAGIIGTYITGSNNTFDSTYPQVSNLGSGLGVNAVYRVTWAAGDATNSTINEVIIVNDAGSDADSSAANTYSRAVLTTVNKTASDSLQITWNWKALGA